MAQVIQRAGGVDAPAAELAPRRRTTWREDAVTVAFSLWMMAGIIADTYAHIHNLPDTFFTPWHGLLYSGFVASFGWILWISLKGSPAVPFTRRIPLGYGLGVVAGALVAFGAVGDGFWHTIFGIERSIEAQLSPTHQLLFLALTVLLASPFRAAYLSDRPAKAPSFREFLPALASLALTMGLITIYLGNANPFPAPAPVVSVFPSAEPGTADHTIIERGFMSILFTNLLLMAPLLLTMRRWRLPFGTAAVLLSVPPAIMIGLHRFTSAGLLLATLAAGLVADRVIAGSRRDADGSRTHLTVAMLTPLVLWSGYFLILQVTNGITWSAELWTGSIVFSVAGAYALHLLMRPARPPQEAGS